MVAVMAFLALFGNMYQYQTSFDQCKLYNFNIKGCEWHKKVVLKYPESLTSEEFSRIDK